MIKRETLVNGFLRNHAAWFEATAEALSPGAGSSPVVTCVVSRHGHMVVPADSPIPTGAIESGLSWLRQHPAERLLVWADRDDRELDIVLASRGLGKGFKLRWMLRDLAQPFPTIDVPDSIQLGRASLDDVPALEAAADIPYVDLSLAAKILRPDFASTAWMLLAREGDSGPIVGHLTLFVPNDGSGWGGVYGAGVRHSRQRRGIGSALTLAACRIARDAGATHLSLNATPDGERAYRKVGFEIIGDGQSWFLEFKADDRAPDDETIAWAERLARGGPEATDAPRATSAAMPNGASPLGFAAHFGQADAARWLIEHGAVPEIPALAKLGMWPEIEVALRDPGAVNARLGPHRRAPLHIAVLENDPKLVSLLLAAGADTSLRDDEFGSTPLQWANHLGHAELARMIAGSGN